MYPKVRDINRNWPDRWRDPYGWDRDFNSDFESLEELLEVLQEGYPDSNFYIDEDGRLYEYEHVKEWSLGEEKKTKKKANK